MRHCPVKEVRQFFSAPADACGCCEGLMAKFRSFNVFDVGVFKLCLLSLGALVGVSYAKILGKWKLLLGVFFGISYLYVIWRMFFYAET